MCWKLSARTHDDVDGGVRGIVAGDMVKRLVTRTIAQQIRSLVERATSPFQYAPSTRAGTECIAHAIQQTLEPQCCPWMGSARVTPHRCHVARIAANGRR